MRIDDAAGRVPGEHSGEGRAPLIEVGLVMVGRLGRVDRQAVAAARAKLNAWLSHRFPEFQWRIVLLRREEVPLDIRQEPAALLQDGNQLRDAQGWDFALMFTSADLVARYKPFALAVTSSALDLAVLSTNRIDPRSANAEVNDDMRQQALLTRLTTLCLRALCHLNGLSASDEPNNLMYQAHAPQALNPDAELSEAQLEQMRHNLRKIADLRLEESVGANELSPAGFYLNSARINRHEIGAAIRHAKPWQFPARLLRLSAAALSTMTILMITAETWHLASSQNLGKMAVLLGLTLVFTTVFVTLRQQLLVRRVSKRISEQMVVTNLSALLIVFAGMLTTVGVLMLFSLSISALFFSHGLVAAWIGAEVAAVGWLNYLQTNFLVTTLGLLIGALGASFEDQYYFRHVVFVDEEM